MSDEAKRIASHIFPVKCKGCGLIYDSIQNKECPECHTSAIRPRLEWSRNDHRMADKLYRGVE